MDWISKARYLNPPIDQTEMVDQITSHFSYNISLALRGLRIQTTNELIQQLYYLQHAHPPNSNNNNNHNNGPSHQNNPNTNNANRYPPRQNNFNRPYSNNNNNNAPPLGSAAPAVPSSEN